MAATSRHRHRPRPPAHTPMDPDVAAACLAALDLGETVCVPGPGDPAAVGQFHAAARQLLQSSGHALASRYLATAVPEPLLNRAAATRTP